MSEPLQIFARALGQLGPISPAALEALTKTLSVRRFAAHEHLLSAGARAQYAFFITTGLVREYYVTDDGSEHTRAFVAEHHFTGSMLDLLTGAPAITFIEALEPTTTVAFRFADFNALCERFLELNAISRRNAEALYLRKARREYEMLALSAEARHANWLADYASIDARISRRQLASYLGITPEHLSRLRHPAAKPQRRKSSRSKSAR